MFDEDAEDDEKKPARGISDKQSRMVGRFAIYETLGKGGYSWVKRGVDTKTQKVVALKFMKRLPRDFDLEQAEQVRTEITSLQQIRHENVVRMMAYNLNANYPLDDGSTMRTVLLVLEYCPGGELFDILFYAERLDEVSARTYFRQLVHGLRAVHKAGVVHRDIKPQNLLLDSAFCLKITDFGLSKIMSTKEEQVMWTTQVGTRGYQAPEILKRQKYTNACDIFAAGVVLFILLAGYPPFEAAHRSDRWYKLLIQGHSEKFWDLHHRVAISEDAKFLLEGMLSYKARNRITLDDVIASKWYNRPVWRNEEIKSKIVDRYVKAKTKKAKDLRNTLKMEDIRTLSADNKKLELFEPALSPGGWKPTSLRTFKSLLAPHKAIFQINHLFTTLLIATKFNPEISSNTIDCAAKVKDDIFEFSLRAYRDGDNLGTLFHIEPIKAPDSLRWAMYYRKIMNELFSYDILISNMPVCIPEEDDIKIGDMV